MLQPRTTRAWLLMVVVACTFLATTLLPPSRGSAEGESSPEPPSTVAQVVSALEDADTAVKLLDKLPDTLELADQARLRELDRQLASEPRIERNPVARKLLLILAATGDVRSLGYLHEVFEAAPERRHHVAHEIAKFALAQRRRPEDWRLLVRAVPIVDGEVARDVLRALQTFNERGTKPQWQRQVILAGLRLGPPDNLEAVGVLRHWTSKSIDAGIVPEEALSVWQSWFDLQHPDLPPPTLPTVLPNSRHQLEDLVELLSSSPDLGDALRGAKTAEKASCLKCHRYGTRGEAMGPDLTNVRQRFQLKELVEEIVFPSQNLSDQYTTVNILTQDGKSFSGVTAADGDQLVILQANGEKVRIDRRTIEEAVPSRKSAMPDGLLEPLTREEVIDLFAYLRRAER